MQKLKVELGRFPKLGRKLHTLHGRCSGRFIEKDIFGQDSTFQSQKSVANTWDLLGSRIGEDENGRNSSKGDERYEIEVSNRQNRTVK